MKATGVSSAVGTRSVKPSVFSSIDKLPLQTFESQFPSLGSQKIKRVLIANRGEIACRVIATCRKLDLVSIAVFTDPDTLSPHVKEADHAVGLGAIDGPLGNPHQNIDLLVQTAIDCRADAIHPGYGYLSENAEFSRKIQEAGLVFLGPSPKSMAILGDKRSAKQYLLKNAPFIPLIPGYNGSEQTVDRLLIEADRIGFPILIKASAGGGGKGMRVVHDRKNLADDLGRAQSEAQRSFGSSDCILEKYIEQSKHIEIQILGDRHGCVVSLMDRECSIQRRHQKVIEEAPSPWLSAQLKSKMSRTAIKIGKLLSYESAGTVEFIVDIKTAEFYFLEVNTRIQVEHPITEETTGLDIVALQLLVASGGRLDALGYFPDGMAAQVGHAIECRLCAEDPSRDFVPDLGTIRRWTPATEVLKDIEAVRYETAIETGSQVSIHFDSLIAKIVVWAPTRPLAIAKMIKMMSYTICSGIRTNQLFLQSCLTNPEFYTPQYSANFIPELLPTLLKNPYVENVPEIQQLLSFLPSMLHRIADSTSRSRRPFSSLPLGFRNQKADAASSHMDIVEILGQQRKAVIIGWPANVMTASQRQDVKIVPLDVAESDQHDFQEAALKFSVQLAQKYNKISSQIRKVHDSTSGTHRVMFRVDRSRAYQSNAADKWQLLDVAFEVDSQKFQAYVASSSRLTASDAGMHQKFFMHSPSLGSSIEFNLYSLLSYGESLRTATSTASISSEQSHKAPMPCKVLSVLKKDGETVEIGEIVMVVESMKMEMNILAGARGKFKALFRKGDPADEGAMLLSIE